MVGQALSIPRSLDALFDIGVVGDLPDGRLLERFTTSHAEAAELAFHTLIDRHGPMVLRVCRRLLDDPNDGRWPPGDAGSSGRAPVRRSAGMTIPIA